MLRNIDPSRARALAHAAARSAAPAGDSARVLAYTADGNRWRQVECASPFDDHLRPRFLREFKEALAACPAEFRISVEVGPFRVRVQWEAALVSSGVTTVTVATTDSPACRLLSLIASGTCGRADRATLLAVQETLAQHDGAVRDQQFDEIAIARRPVVAIFRRDTGPVTAADLIGAAVARATAAVYVRVPAGGRFYE